MIGWALYKIYDFLGYNVVRINYVGDYGTPFGKMIAGYKALGQPRRCFSSWRGCYSGLVC